MVRLSMMLVLMFSIPVFSADKKASSTNSAAPSEIRPLEIDPASSSVSWLGKKVTGQHNGSVQIKSGQVQVKGKDLVGGKIEIDMTTIKNEDLKDAEYNKKLVSHLNSDDFFSVDKNPVSTFVVKSVKPGGDKGATHTITGDLTIKGITNSVTFPATLKEEGGKWRGDATVAIDRTKWNVKYNSGKFFPNLGDKVINDEFTLTLKLMTK